MKTAAQIRNFIDETLSVYNESPGRELLQEATEIGKKRVAPIAGQPGKTEPEINNIQRRVEIALNDTFKGITGVDLFKPFELWKADWLASALATENWKALTGFQSGKKELSNYVRIYVRMLQDLRTQLTNYINTTPTAPPATIEPIDPTTPIEPGGPVTPPATNKSYLPLLLVGAGALFFLSRK